jgi:GWxTD domain-containing protein
MYCRCIVLACCFCAAIGSPQTTSKRQAQRLRQELKSAYTKWPDQDVAYILSDAERSAFGGLHNDEEREQFIEEFWRRRDPTPETEENEFKEEHYRRIAYANEHFASGMPGWKTDRGRIYITFGPPDEIESHPSGGTYQRTPNEGGGNTTTYPFERWRYRYLADIGNDIVIEFVDPTMSGEYRMTIDPNEKASGVAESGEQQSVHENGDSVQAVQAAAHAGAAGDGAQRGVV